MSVPTVAPKIWLTGRPPNLEAIVGNSPQPNNGPNPINNAMKSISHLLVIKFMYVKLLLNHHTISIFDCTRLQKMS